MTNLSPFMPASYPFLFLIQIQFCLCTDHRVTIEWRTFRWKIATGLLWHYRCISEYRNDKMPFTHRWPCCNNNQITIFASGVNPSKGGESWMELQSNIFWAFLLPNYDNASPHDGLMVMSSLYGYSFLQSQKRRRFHFIQKLERRSLSPPRTHPELNIRGQFESFRADWLLLWFCACTRYFGCWGNFGSKFVIIKGLHLLRAKSLHFSEAEAVTCNKSIGYYRNNLRNWPKNNLSDVIFVEASTLIILITFV